MAVLPIHRFPDPLLKTPARAVARLAPPVVRFIEDLVETMRAHPRCVGLAAPQVGQAVRIAVVDVAGHPKASQAHGLIVLVNPRITAQEGVSIQREGCLSVPDLTGNVSRSLRVHVEALDASGRPWAGWFKGFEAIAVQHELDHLEGRLFLDQIANVRTDLFRRQRYG